MNIRKPAVAGQFYGGSKAECLAEVQECLRGRPIPAELPKPIVGAIVPHAGWVFSGDLAAMAFRAIQQSNGNVDTFILFGAAHRYFEGGNAVFESGEWETPLGRIEIDAGLAAKIAGEGAIANASAHRGEHSIEVQVPFIQHLFPKARIVPVVVPTGEFETEFGERVGRMLAGTEGKVVCIGSTDLTHYGPRYGFCAQGSGKAGIKWAHEVNDKTFIDLALKMKAQEMFNVAMEDGSACGPGAAATVVAAAKAMGRTSGVLLAHTNSSDVMMEKFKEQSEESVGYAAMVF